MFFSDINYLGLKSTATSILEDEADIYQAIYTLFATKRGTRVFRPNYGANLSKYLFEPCDEITASNILYDVKSALKEEPRIELNTAETMVVPDPVNRQFIISISFIIPKLSTQKKNITLTYKQQNRGTV